MKYRYLEEEKWNYYVWVVPIILFFSAFLLWAGFSQIDEVVRAQGKVIPSGQTKILQHLEGGIIENIIVKEGDHVEKGDVIYKLKNEYFYSQQKEKELELLAYKAKAKRLKALTDKTKLEYPQVFKINIPYIVANEKSIFMEQRRNNKNKIAIIRNQYQQKKLKLRELRSRLKNLKIEYELATDSMRIKERLYKKKVVSREKYLQELSKKQKIYTELEEVRNTIPVVKEEMKEWSRKVEKERSEIISESLKKYTAIKIEINKLKEKIKADVDRAQRTEILSPVKGIVNKLHFYTIGGIVKPGDITAEISPIDDQLIIEAKIKTSDRAQVREGQKVSIEITAYDFSEYGLLDGELMRISPDSTTDEHGTNYYLVRVKANNFMFNDKSPIMIGMVANVNILTAKRSVLHYIIKPLKDISQKALKEH